MVSSTRQLALERELEQLININSVVGSLIDTIRVTQRNIVRTNEATQSTDKLLDQWIRILSQAKFTREVLQNVNWDGSPESEDDNVDLKLQEEQSLLNELNQLTQENKLLSDKLLEKHENERMEEQKRKDILNKRHRELGLRSVSRQRQLRPFR